MNGRRPFTVYPPYQRRVPILRVLRRVLSLEGLPSPLSSRLPRRAVGPERSWASGPTQGDQKQLLFSN
jgi:hypothetical protein